MAGAGRRAAARRSRPPRRATSTRSCNTAPAELLPASSDPLGKPSVDDELSQGKLSLVFANAAVFADAPAKVGRGFRPPAATTVESSVIDELQNARFEVQIASPYFIPGRTGVALLKEAIVYGVYSVVFTNSLGATDEPLVHFRYVRYRKAMLKLGVTIYELSPTWCDGRDHSATLASRSADCMPR